jgi:hypothetical protein
VPAGEHHVVLRAAFNHALLTGRACFHRQAIIAVHENVARAVGRSGSAAAGFAAAAENVGDVILRERSIAFEILQEGIDRFLETIYLVSIADNFQRIAARNNFQLREKGPDKFQLRIIHTIDHHRIDGYDLKIFFCQFYKSLETKLHSLLPGR